MICRCGFVFSQDMIEMGSICPKCNYLPRDNRPESRIPTEKTTAITIPKGLGVWE